MRPETNPFSLRLRFLTTRVTPGTFVRWQRKGFKQYWRWKSRGGRPALPQGHTPAHRSHGEGEHNLERRARR
jgi:hypothetical protein